MNFLTNQMYVLAANPGVKFADWLTTNISAIFVAGIAVFGLIILVKRKIMQGIILMIIAAFGAVLVYSGSEFAQKIADIIVGWFS